MKHPKGDPKFKGESSERNVLTAEEVAREKDRLSATLLLDQKTPAHPPPVRMAHPSASLALAKLGKESKKKDPKERKGSVDKSSPSSESSEEHVLDTNLVKEEKEDKKTAEVKPGTSPALSTPNSEDASMLSGLLDEDGTGNGDNTSNEEQSPNTDILNTDDLLNSITPLNEDDTATAKQDDAVSTAGKQDDAGVTAADFEKYIQAIQNNNIVTRPWCDAKEFPDLKEVEPDSEDIDKYIEDVLSHSHKWKDQKDVKCTMDGVDLKDQMARTNCKYTKNLFLRLGVASNPHLEIAKAHAASMKESALTWQEKAINSINKVAASIRQDNKKTLRDIKREAAQEAKELRKQLESLNKKYADLQTELDFTSAALNLKNKMEIPKDVNLDTQKITELTRELGEQRKSNEELEKQLRELLESFTNYKSGHLREELEINRQDKMDFKKEPHIKEEPIGDSRRKRSPSWGKTRKDETPVSSNWESKGESSATSDFGWGPTRGRRHGKSRTPPRDDTRFEKPQPRRGDRNDSWNGKRRGSPIRNSHAAKRLSQKKNGSRKVHWEHLSGKETTKSERIYGARESQTHRI